MYLTNHVQHQNIACELVFHVVARALLAPICFSFFLLLSFVAKNLTFYSAANDELFSAPIFNQHHSTVSKIHSAVAMRWSLKKIFSKNQWMHNHLVIWNFAPHFSTIITIAVITQSDLHLARWLQQHDSDVHH